jgi:phenylacetate-CoA ligase
MYQEGMHFCAQDAVWPELISPESGDPIEFETGAVGELVYTSLSREGTPVVRFRSADIAEVLGTSCPCGRTGFRVRILGRTDDMFIVRGVNVYPTAIQAVVAEFRPLVTGRARVVLPEGVVSVDPPVRVEVEVADFKEPVSDESRRSLADDVSHRLRTRLTFKTDVVLLPERDFAPAGYKTRGVVRT